MEKGYIKKREINKVEIIDEDDEPTLEDLETIDVSTDEEIDTEFIVSDKVIYDEEALEKRQRRSYVQDSLSMYLSRAGNHDILSREEELELGVRIANGDESAENILMTSNLKLVISVAKKYQGYAGNTSMALVDLIQVGNIGLSKAVKRYDYTKGYKFSTYATWWIKQAIMKEIQNNGKMIRLPTYIHQLINKISILEKEYGQLMSQKPTDEQLYNYVKENGVDNVSWLKFKELITMKDVISYDDIVNEEGTSLLTFIGDESTNFENDMIKNLSLKKAILSLLYMTKNASDSRNTELFIIKNGLVDGNIRTLESIGDAYGLTKERVRQIDFRLMTKIKSIVTKETKRLGISEISSFEEAVDVLCQYVDNTGIDLNKAEKEVNQVFQKAQKMAPKVKYKK